MFPYCLARLLELLVHADRATDEPEQDDTRILQAGGEQEAGVWVEHTDDNPHGSEVDAHFR